MAISDKIHGEIKESNEPGTIIELIKGLQRRGVQPIEYRKYVNRLLEFKARKDHIPIHGTFELTPFCNLSCKMCYVRLDKNQYDVNKLLSAKQWKSIISQAHDMGMISASLTGGECLTYPEFDEVYLYLREKGISTSILSNGVLMDKKRIDFFKRYPPIVIHITLYGSSEESYERVTGYKAYNKVCENLIMLRDTDIPLTLGITPNKYMVEDMYALMDFVESLHIPYHINSGLFTPRVNTGREKEDFTIDQYIEILKYYDKLKHIVREPVELGELPDENHDGKKKKGLQCGGGRSTFAIMYNGEMSPCVALDNISVKPLEDGFAEAWKSLNNLADNYLIPGECVDCIYKKECIHCVAIHKNAPLLGHCDPIVCERTKKMIRTGLIHFHG